jgi:hypothetical protein
MSKVFGVVLQLVHLQLIQANLWMSIYYLIDYLFIIIKFIY